MSRKDKSGDGKKDGSDAPKPGERRLRRVMVWTTPEGVGGRSAKAAGGSRGVCVNNDAKVAGGCRGRCDSGHDGWHVYLMICSCLSTRTCLLHFLRARTSLHTSPHTPPDTHTGVKQGYTALCSDRRSSTSCFSPHLPQHFHPPPPTSCFSSHFSTHCPHTPHRCEAELHRAVLRSHRHSARQPAGGGEGRRRLRGAARLGRGYRTGTHRGARQEKGAGASGGQSVGKCGASV